MSHLVALEGAAGRDGHAGSLGRHGGCGGADAIGRQRQRQLRLGRAERAVRRLQEGGKSAPEVSAQPAFAMLQGEGPLDGFFNMQGYPHHRGHGVELASSSLQAPACY
jgi:hypothetical protein